MELKGGNDMKKLDCGHFPSPHGKHTTGTTHFNDQEVCWDCAYNIEKRDAIKHGKMLAYLSENRNEITNWTGKAFSTDVCILREMRDNFGGERTYLRFRFNREVWSGFTMGRGMYLRAKRTKLHNLYA